MPETLAPSARTHRVTTRRQHLRELACPLEPEVLVAEFALELPPDVALAVREHVAVCETCGERSRALQGPYTMLASLGDEPVPYVPDLRESVRVGTARRAIVRRVRRAARAVGKGGTLGIVTALGIAALVVLIIFVGVLPSRNAAAARSTNTVAHPAAAGAGGLVYMETGKVTSISGLGGASNGKSWLAAEVIAVNEQTGQVVRSLPASGSLALATHGQLPVATTLNAQGTVVYQLTSAAHSPQSLLAFDARNGKTLLTAPITALQGAPLPNGVTATSLVLSPDGQTAYVGLTQQTVSAKSARVLAINTQNGQVLRSFGVDIPASVVLPPPAGSLPASAFPSLVPHVNTAGFNASLGVNGALALAPDGQSLLDVVQIKDKQGKSYGILRRFNVETGQLLGAFGLPGTFTFAKMATSTGTAQPQLYLVTGTPDAECYILDISAAQPTLAGDVPLGGPVVPSGVHYTEALSLSAATNNTLYITQDVKASDNTIEGHDVWTIDTHGMTLLAHRADPTDDGEVLANTPGGAKGKIFLLRDGAVSTLSPSLGDSPSTWLKLNDGTVQQLLTAK